MNFLKKNQDEQVAESVESGENRPRGTWEETSTMNDEEAHRDVRYSIKSSFNQTVCMFKTQMALYSKRKSIYVLLVMAIMIPIIYYYIKDIFPMGTFTEKSGNGMMGLMLFLLPLVMALFTGSLLSSLMPKEFKDRSAYMNMALPMSRFSFCIGKYLAGLVVTVGVFVFAFGMAMAGSMTDYTQYDEESLGLAFILMVLALMVFTSFAFAIGCFIKRGTTILAFIIMGFILPSIELYLAMSEKVDMDMLMFMPNLLPDMVSISLGSNATGSVVGFINAFVPIIDIAELNLVTVTVISIVWTLVFLGIGIFAVSRREM